LNLFNCRKPGKLSTGDITKIIDGKDRKKAGPTVPPQGLTMLNIIYEK